MMREMNGDEEIKAFNEKYVDTQENFNNVHAFLRKMVTLTGKLQTWEFVRFEFWNRYEAPKVQTLISWRIMHTYGRMKQVRSQACSFPNPEAVSSV
ncbi:hypothetical protein [Paenibacillus rhizoplanae]|uniref:hypothetical protein n=1 Tax=Paenibacillus rhizoplanae TaxID=1917181 RepID=UPI00361B2B29